MSTCVDVRGLGCFVGGVGLVGWSLRGWVFVCLRARGLGGGVCVVLCVCGGCSLIFGECVGWCAWRLRVLSLLVVWSVLGVFLLGVCVAKGQVYGVLLHARRAFWV